MIGRLVDAVMEHFGITDEQVEKVKTILDMVEFKEVNGKKIAYLTIGEGLEIKIVQPEEDEATQRAADILREKAAEFDRVLMVKGIFGNEG